MINERIVDLLNRLIVINNDRIEGYQTAAKETLEEDNIQIKSSKFSVFL